MSHTRKYLKNTALSDLPEPKDGEEIVKAIALPGGNIVEVDCGNGGSTYIASIPAKFNKMIWISKGTFMIVRKAEQNETASSRVVGLVTSVLFEDQIKHLKERGLWPAAFSTPSRGEDLVERNPALLAEDDADGSEELLPDNPNRIGVQDTGSDSSDYEF